MTESNSDATDYEQYQRATELQPDGGGSWEDPADSADDPIERAFHLCDRAGVNGRQLAEDVPTIEADPEAWGPAELGSLDEYLDEIRRRVDDLVGDVGAAKVALREVREDGETA